MSVKQSTGRKDGRHTADLRFVSLDLYVFTFVNATWARKHFKNMEPYETKKTIFRDAIRVSVP